MRHAAETRRMTYGSGQRGRVAHCRARMVSISRLLDHDRDRVVDLVGDPGRQLADRCRLPGLHDLLVHQIPLTTSMGMTEAPIVRSIVFRTRVR